MNKVIKKRLGDIVNFKRGYDLPAYNRIEGKFPIISSSGISGYHSEYKKDGEGLITGRYGTLGVVYYINGKYWPHNTALYVTDFKGNYPKYAYFLMKCLGNLKTSDKSTVPGINRNDLHEILVPYISREFQKPLADCLYNIEKKIELNSRINAELEAMAKTLYDYWFVQFEFPFDFAQGKPDPNGKPYKSSSGKMGWNEDLKREIPEGWKVGTIKNVISNVKETEGIDSNINLPYIPIDNLPIRKLISGEYSPNNEANSSLILFKKYDILLGAMRVYFHRVCLAIQDGITRTTVFVLRPKEEYLKYYSLFTISTEASIAFATINSKGSTMPYTFWEHGYENFAIVIPPKELLLAFNKIVDPILEKSAKNELENQHLSSLRDWLLPMLMNGQVTSTSSVTGKEASYKIEEEMRMAAEPGA